MILPMPTATSAISTMRVRPLSNISRSIVNEAVRRSPTVRRLLFELHQRDVLIFVDINASPNAELGTTSVLAHAGGFRMIRVLINEREEDHADTYSGG